MAPAERAVDRTGIAAGAVEVVVAAVGIGLQDALPSGEVPVGMGHLPVAGEVKQRGRRRAARKGAVVADIGPEPCRARAAPRQQRHCRVVAVQPLRPQDMLADQTVKGGERGGTGTNLIGQRRQAEIDAFPGVALGLPVQRLMRTELLEQDRRQ